MSQSLYSDTGSASKTFKIRKTKAKLLQQIQERQQVANLNDIDPTTLRKQKSQNHQQDPTNTPIQVKTYQDDEEEVNCYRFPHSKFCGCQNNCLLQSFEPIQISPQLFYGNFVTGLKTKHLLELGVTHVLNVTSKQYTKRSHYFQYLNIDLHYNNEEDAKKFFRISNRFIKNAIQQGGKVFVHSSVLQLGAIMSLGYLIGVQKISFKQGMSKVLKNDIEISPHFLKQLQSYDLQKMAFVSRKGE